MVVHDVLCSALSGRRGERKKEADSELADAVTEPPDAYLSLGLYVGSLLIECGLNLAPYSSMYHHTQFNRGFDGEFFLPAFEHATAHLAQQNADALRRIGELDAQVQGALS